MPARRFSWNHGTSYDKFSLYELFTGDSKVPVKAKYRWQQSTGTILRTHIVDYFESTGDSKVPVTAKYRYYIENAGPTQLVPEPSQQRHAKGLFINIIIELYWSIDLNFNFTQCQLREKGEGGCLNLQVLVGTGDTKFSNPDFEVPVRKYLYELGLGRAAI